MLLQWLASWVIQCFKQSHMCCTRTLTYTSAREQTQKKAVSKKYPTFQLQNTLMVLITFLLSITYLQALKKNMTCILSQNILSVSLRTQALLHRQHEVKSLSMHPWIAWSCQGQPSCRAAAASPVPSWAHCRQGKASRNACSAPRFLPTWKHVGLCWTGSGEAKQMWDSYHFLGNAWEVGICS